MTDWIGVHPLQFSVPSRQELQRAPPHQVPSGGQREGTLAHSPMFLRVAQSH